MSVVPVNKPLKSRSNREIASYRLEEEINENNQQGFFYKTLEVTLFFQPEPCDNNNIKCARYKLIVKVIMNNKSRFLPLA